MLVEAGDIIPVMAKSLKGRLGRRERHYRESAPVIRESGGDFASVTGGTRILSDWLVIQCSVNPGETFLDRMIAMVEGAQRRKTPNEIALTILLVALTIVFLLATATLWPLLQLRGHRGQHHRAGGAAGLPDPNHHRRPALRYWCGGYEPHAGRERYRHQRTRRRGRR